MREWPSMHPTKWLAVLLVSKQGFLPNHRLVIFARISRWRNKESIHHNLSSSDNQQTSTNGPGNLRRNYSLIARFWTWIMLWRHGQNYPELLAGFDKISLLCLFSLHLQWLVTLILSTSDWSKSILNDTLTALFGSSIALCNYNQLTSSRCHNRVLTANALFPSHPLHHIKYTQTWTVKLHSTLTVF